MFEGPGSRFSNVVEECRKANPKTRRTLARHCDCVTQHVFMLMDRVLFKAKSWQFRKEFIGPSRVNQLPQTVTGIIFAKNIVQTLGRISDSHVIRWGSVETRFLHGATRRH